MRYILKFASGARLTGAAKSAWFMICHEGIAALPHLGVGVVDFLTWCNAEPHGPERMNSTPYCSLLIVGYGALSTRTPLGSPTCR